MSDPNLSPGEVLDAFAQNLATDAAKHGVSVARTFGDGSDRLFHLKFQACELRFLVKLSRSSQGWWGVMYTRADEMVAQGLALVLLTADKRGFYIRPSRLKATLAKASQSEVQFEINERIIKHEPFFVNTSQLYELLSNDARGST
jgi:hypothetical protein